MAVESHRFEGTRRSPVVIGVTAWWNIHNYNVRQAAIKEYKVKLTPLVPGHEIVGRVAAVGDAVATLSTGQRVGIPWLGATCNACRDCGSGRENLCVSARFTGYQIDGGYAEYALADETACFPIPEGYPDLHAAPLLCAGLIGYRALRMAGDARSLGLYGYGAAAHIVAQVARHEGRRVFAFVRPGDEPARRFALELGAAWAGGSDQAPPEPLEAAIVFAAAGALVPAALRAVDKGGVVVCGGIHMEQVTIENVKKIEHLDAENYMIRDFIVIIPKGSILPSYTTI